MVSVSADFQLDAKSASIARLETASASPSDFNGAAHGLRGLASVMVLVAHIIGGTARHIFPDNLAYVEAVKRPWFFGTFGVELFFAISGFVILPSVLRYSYSEFAIRRFMRIYPLFFVLSVIFCLLNFHTNNYPKMNNVESIVSGLLFINLFIGTEQLTPNAWSLSFEVIFYILTCVFVELSIKRRAGVWAVLAIMASIIFTIMFPITIYFIIGLVARVISKYKYPHGLVRNCAEIIALISMIFLASRGHYEYVRNDLSNLSVILLIIATAIYFYFAILPGSLTGRALSNRPARYLGTISYSLYLVHPYIYFGVRGVFSHFHWFGADPWMSVVPFGLIVAALSIFVSHFVNITLEQGPYKWYFHQRVYQPKIAPRPCDDITSFR